MDENVVVQLRTEACSDTYVDVEAVKKLSDDHAAAIITDIEQTLTAMKYHYEMGNYMLLLKLYKKLRDDITADLKDLEG